MKNRFLVANPFGTFLIRCDTMDEVKEFVRQHLSKCKQAYKKLVGEGVEVQAHNYQVRDLTEIRTYADYLLDNH